MKCSKCGFENKEKAKFCTKCGMPLNVQEVEKASKSSDNSRYIIIALVVIIILLAGTIGYFALNSNSNPVQDSDNSQSADSQDANAADKTEQEDDSDSAKTAETSSSQSSSSAEEADSKSWESIGSYSGSGSGSKTISVPAGKIMVKLSAYPIKNYDTNHLYVSGTNGESGGVDWGSKSAVETRSDSFTYKSSSEETFTIDYYETVSWEVEFFRYQ